MQHMPMRTFAILALLLLCACGGGASTGNAGSTQIPVVTTISTFNSLVTGVGGAHVRVQSLVPVGASPETYQPAPQDVATLAQARLLVENGAGLEAWLGRTIANTGAKNLVIVVGSAGLPVVNDNPHLWMDPLYAKHYVEQIRNALIRIDPEHANDYRKNAAHYEGKIEALADSIRARINTIPPSQRKMIVFHNAWQYYNDRFGITTLGFIEANPGQDPNPQRIAHLIDLARQNHLHAIFSEPEYSPKLAQQIAGNSNIHIVDNLYDDSVGTNPQVADYLSMLNYDTNVIVRAMR
jgi:manganese/iron transport system substrate-binding protein